MSKNSISIHFDGPITEDHSVQLRAFSKTLSHIQTAIDRAYLDVKYGSIWKNARLRDEDYAQTDFMMAQTREGGFIADLLGSSEDGSAHIVKRIENAVAPAYEQASAPVVEEQERLVDQAEARRRNYNAGAQTSMEYGQFMNSPDAPQTRAYGDRSIVKEFDQIASAIRARDGDGSFVEVTLHAGKALSTFVFDQRISAAFHNVVSVRSLGDLVEIPITLRGLDSGSGGISKAKALNLISRKEFNLHIHTDKGFSGLRRYLKKRNPPEFRIVACPVLEYGAFDPLAGDMYFISIVKEES
ncbi:hypothetical protein G3N95_36960 [Paraburkholderia sp. Tr-20389]|uniref:hypothetical protein n=1 Tax=Paraburkholderia sp. Tr-20389 TaxID=2703903 RepID=UPI00197D7598|nr:hypothetical protein [Paraburkholderia sp. Tr-20389]MBN3758550.1 hypothetical protein [Paraburkholderia sp. Tr-20389]